MRNANFKKYAGLFRRPPNVANRIRLRRATSNAHVFNKISYAGLSKWSQRGGLENRLPNRHGGSNPSACAKNNSIVDTISAMEFYFLALKPLILMAFRTFFSTVPIKQYKRHFARHKKLYQCVDALVTLSHKSIQNHGYIIPLNAKILFHNY